MSWDWDKLQEKKQRQNWSSNRNQKDNDNNLSNPNGSNPNGHPFFKNIKKYFESRPHSSGIKWVLLILVLLWILSGIYIVHPDEQGVVLLFGKYNRTVDAGPHYALPFPIETVYKPKVTQVRRVEVGFRSTSLGGTFQQGATRTLPEEASMLTGDENIVNVQFSVQYQIKNPVEYLFHTANPTAVVKSAAEAAMREVIGNSKIDSALTDGKIQIQNEATELLQEILDRYQVGIHVLAVQLQDVHPPKEVSDSFKDVASAREDKSRIINEAEAYRNEIIPKARGLAAEIVNKAQAYQETRIKNAEGEAARFQALLIEYNQAKDITKKRMYFEAMEDILNQPEMEKIILNSSIANKALPLLPLFQDKSVKKTPTAKKME